MLLPEVLVDLARVLVVATVEARAIGVEGGAPGLVPREEIAEQGERLGLGGGGARAAVGGVGGGLAARDHIVTPVRLRIVRLRAELGEREPCAGVLRIGGDRRAEQRAGVLESLVGDRRRRILAQLIRGLALDLRPDLRGLFAQRFREPDDVAREILAGIGLDVRGPSRPAKAMNKKASKRRSAIGMVQPPFGRRAFRAAVLLPHRNYVASTTVLAPRPDARRRGTAQMCRTSRTCRYWVGFWTARRFRPEGTVALFAYSRNLTKRLSPEFRDLFERS